MAEEKEKLEFPIKGHDKCPNCGCEKGIGMETIRQLKEEGFLSKEIFPKGFMVQTPLPDPGHLQKLLTPTADIPVFTWYYDICLECKTLYIREVELTFQKVSIGMQQMTGRPRGFTPPPFLRG